MDVSIIIINYNTTDLVRQCITSLIEKTKQNSYEIIVIDNASADRSIEGLQSEFEQVLFIFNGHNEGFGPANNQGIAIAKGKYVMLINSDTYLLNDAIGILYNYMEAPGNEKVGCCGADLFDEEGGRQASCGNFPTLVEAISALGFHLLYREYFYRHLSSGVINYSDDIKVVDYICGADMFLRKTALQETGTFDPRFFLYFEETELSFRLSKSGYRSVLVPGAKIVHLEGGSQSVQAEFNYSKIALFAKSRRLFFKLCYGPVSAFFVNYIYALQSLLFYVSKRKSGYLKSAKILLQS